MNANMTQQEIYDTVKKHLLTQMEASQTEDGQLRCVYRGPKGLKCAIGCLIPDEVYNPEMDGDQDSAIATILSEYHNLPSFFYELHNLEFFQRLQRIHDSTPVCYWEDELKKLAAIYELVP